jgi:gliding motility-associated-like protein
MKLITALLCTAIFLSINFQLIGQQIALNKEIKEHAKSHVKPGMSAAQIDSLYAIAEHNHEQNEAQIAALVKAAQKAKKSSSALKSVDCENENWGFDMGTTTNWATSGCVQLENGGFDIYSGFPKVNSGDFSLKLSNDMNWNCLNSAAARTYSVPAAGETFITIHFAVNIFNFPHFAEHAAAFNFDLYDDDMNVLACPSYEAYFASDEGPVGIPSLQETPSPATFYNPLVAGDLWFNSNVSYSNWHHVTIDLSDYAGTDVTMVFQNKWCAFNIDWIYTYIDVDCPINNAQPIPVCEEGPVELCAPQGMQASYDWEFNNASLINDDACITANETGTYTLNFMPDYLECSNTAYEINFELITQPIANFSSAEFCIGDPILIQNLSQYGTTYEWQYNNEVFNEFVPSLDYDTNSDELMLITITGSCRDTVVHPLIARKKPLAAFNFENECVGVPYKIVNLSTDPDESPLEAHWTISPDYESNAWDPQYVASDDNIFVLSLLITNDFGCFTEIQSKAQAFPLPKAQFEQSEELLSENTALAYFQDASSDDVITWDWTINDDHIYNGTEFYHEFLGAGFFEISLIVFNEYSCSDTATSEVLVNPYLSLYVPNTFTPNGDEHNQFFYPVFSGSDFDRKGYSFQVFNRWGEIVFQSNNFQEGWNGYHHGEQCVQGTYSWKISYTENISQEVKEVVGHVNLVR